MPDDIIINKCNVIQNCLRRIREEYEGHEDSLSYDFTRQDSIVLNLQRACEAAIELGMRWLRNDKLGVPQSGRDVFVIMEANNLIPKELSQDLQAMVGFRNIAVHDYQKINIVIVRAILDKKLSNFTQLIDIALQR